MGCRRTSGSSHKLRRPRGDRAPAAATPPAAILDAESSPSQSTRGWRQHLTMRGMASFMVSCVFHVALILVLALLVALDPTSAYRTLLVSRPTDEGLSPEDLESTRITSTDDASAESAASLVPIDSNMVLPLSADPLAHEDKRATTPVPESLATARQEALLRSTGRTGGGFQGRVGELKAQRLAAGGGTPESEGAVALGLAWLAAHQWQDGGWRLKFTGGPCNNQCQNPGGTETTTGATGLALLPFLGAGHTHMSGEYRDVVHNGLYYLKNHAIMTPNGADLQEGTMYSQGIATMALCEAYAMTQDPDLRVPAQRAVDFICYAQHSGGGWRYYPQQPGDTTVFGWQMMALKSASLAGLDVPSPVITLGEKFLDSVQSGGGAYYGYMERSNKPGPTAVGLLIRMYTGWHRDDDRLQRGVEFLVKQGSSPRDVYYDYYATQVLHHFGGPDWPAWNEKMRDYLIETQATSGT